MAQYPTIAAGQRITAALLRSMMDDFVVKASNTERTSTTTLADDPELVTDTLVSGATYWIQFLMGCSANTTGDIKFAWNVPSGSTGLRRSNGPGSTASDSDADNVAGRFGIHGFTTAIPYSGVRNSANQFWVREEGLVTVGTAGTAAIQWAQNTSTATLASRVASGSLLFWRRLA